MCDGSDPLHTGAVPKTEHNEGVDPKTELKKLNTALRLVCWYVSLLFCRVSFLVGRLASRSSFVLVCFGGFPRCVFSRGRAATPEPITFGRYSLTYVMAAGLRSIGYATFCGAFPGAIGNSGRHIYLGSTSSVGSGFYVLLFLKSMKATVFMYVASLCCRVISGFSPHRTS